MPDFGYYEKRPRPQSIETLERYLEANPMVKSTSVDDQILHVMRKGDRTDLKVYLTNIYIVSVADVHEILSAHGDLNAIVTMSEWNAYSEEAEDLCKKHKIGLFKFKEFLGAVYYDDYEFVGYRPPKQDPRRRYRTDTGS